jgi:NAD(P)-dependent dehydrogenase (short-subunit alcohol dehydrogenase family)
MRPWATAGAISLVAAAEGAAVACLDADGAAARTTAGLIEGTGGRAAVMVGDVSDPAQASACVSRAAEALGGLDGLVLNVGVGRGSWLAGTTADDWDAVFAVNVRSHFLAAQAAVAQLSAGSSIVFIGSVAGLRPGSSIPSYDASKAALIGLCRHVALEGAGRGIRANLVAPGLIDSPLG